jgi:hypothetical protein
MKLAGVSLALLATLLPACNRSAPPAALPPVLEFSATDLIAAEMSPMAPTVIGGVMTSSLLTLIVVPVIYTYLDDFTQWLRRRFGAPSGESA